MENFLTTPLKAIMRPPHRIKQDRPVRELVNLLLNHSINEALVLNQEERPIGVVTKTDILRHSVQSITHKTETEAYRKSEDGTMVPLMHRKAEVLEVQKIMSPKIFTLSQNTTVKEAIQFMIQEDFHRIFVHGESKAEVVGVVGMTDLMRYAVEKKES